jgi:hypothetical protein
MSTNQYDIWIGLANVQADKIRSSIKDANYAYVTVVGRAKGRNDFRNKVARELCALHFNLLRLEEPEKFEARLAHHEVNESVRCLAGELQDGGEDIKFSTFHTYD